MSVECQVNIKSQSELDIGGRETCLITIFIYAAQQVHLSVCPLVCLAQANLNFCVVWATFSPCLPPADLPNTKSRNC